MPRAPYRNAIRSKRMIRDAFIELMRKKPFSAIRVREVLELSTVSKGTFYAHYTSLNDILLEIEKDCLSLLFQGLEHTVQGEDFYPLFLHGLKEIEQETELFCLLFQSSYRDSFLAKLRQRFNDHLLSSRLYGRYFVSEQQAQFCLTFVAGGAIALIQAWMEQNFSVPAEQMAHLLNECALHGVSQMKE